MALSEQVGSVLDAPSQHCLQRDEFGRRVQHALPSVPATQVHDEAAATDEENQKDEADELHVLTVGHAGDALPALRVACDELSEREGKELCWNALEGKRSCEEYRVVADEHEGLSVWNDETRKDESCIGLTRASGQWGIPAPVG